MPSRTRDPLDVALRALGRRELTTQELLVKLARAGVPDADARAVLDRVRAAGYLSDERAARERARVLADRGRGDEAIRADLRRRGLAEEAVEDAISDLRPERERARVVADRHEGGRPRVHALLRAGFSEETVAAIAGPSLRRTAPPLRRTTGQG